MAPIKPEISRMSDRKWNKQSEKVTWILTAEHGNLYFLCDNKNFGQHFADYRGKAFAYSGHFKNKLRVAEVDNAGGWSLKMLEWM